MTSSKKGLGEPNGIVLFKLIVGACLAIVNKILSDFFWQRMERLSNAKVRLRKHALETFQIGL